MTTLIRGFRAYVFDPLHEIMDYQTFLSVSEAEDWAATEWSGHQRTVTPMTVDQDNASFSRLCDGLELAGIAVRDEDGTARPGIFGLPGVAS
jgi:hypothetical protein